MSLNQTLIKYPEDLTGTSPYNLIQDERKSIPRTTSRHFAPKFGPFFAESITVRTVPGNVPLIKDQDFAVLLRDEQGSLATGQTVAYIVAITNPAYFGELSYGYQTLGGNYSASTDSIKQLIENLEIDNRTIQFDDLIDLPITFPPSPHMHVVGDLYGWEDMVDIGEQIATQIELGQQSPMLAINNRIDALGTGLDTLTNHVNTTILSQILNNTDDISDLKADLSNAVQVSESLTAAADLNLASMNFTKLAVGGTMRAGGCYHLTDTATYSLQSTAGANFFGKPLKIGDEIEFVCRYDASAIIATFNAVTERIQYKGKSDSSARASGVKSGRIVYIGPGTWEIFA